MTIRGRLDDRLGGDITARAQPVFDDELLAKPLREPFTYQAREDIGRAASAKADDQAHRP